MRTTLQVIVAAALAFVAALAGKAHAAPVNDDFENRTVLTGSLPISASGSTVGATLQTGEPAHSYYGSHSAWWSWTAQETGPVQVGTDGSSFNTVLAVYEGGSLNELALAGRNNDVGYSDSSRVPFMAVAGRTYQIAVDGAYSYEAGSVALRIESTAAAVITSPRTAVAQVGAPFRYQIAADRPLNSVYVYDLPPGCSYDYWTGIISGTPLFLGRTQIRFFAYFSDSSCESGIVVTVSDLPQPVITSASFGGTQGEPLEYQITATKNPSSFSATGLPQGLTLDTTTGRISGAPLVAGNFTLTLRASNAAGDGMESSVLVSVGSGAPVVIESAFQLTKGQPFSEQAPVQHAATQFTATGLPPGIQIDALTGAFSGTPAEVGVYYATLTAANAFGSGTGQVTFQVYDPSSDAFATRVRLYGSDISLLVSNEWATKEFGEPSHGGNRGAASLWWTWTAPETGVYEISTDDGQPVLFAVYQGKSLTSLKEIVSNLGGDEGRPYAMAFAATAGQTYQVALDGVDGNVGEFSLHLNKLQGNAARIFTVDCSEGGSVSPGFLGTSFRRLGARYAISARTAPGFRFVGWSGSVRSTSPTISFRMQEDFNLHAEFAPDFAAEAAGAFMGLIQNDSDNYRTSSSTGALRILLTRGGVFTATVAFGGDRYRLRGRFDPTGNYTGLILRANQWPLTVQLSYRNEGGGAGLLEGAISDEDRLASITARRAEYHRTHNPAPMAGRYTFNFDVSTGLVPQFGSGYGIVRIDASGRLRFTGTLPDGSPVSQGTFIAGDGDWNIYLPMSGGRGSAAGSVWFGEGEAAPGGTLRWFIPPAVVAGAVVEGTSLGVYVSGERYAIPSKGSPLLSLNDGPDNVAVVFQAADADSPEDWYVSYNATMNAGNHVAVHRGDLLSVRIDAKNGLFSGTFWDPRVRRAARFAGVFSQSGNSGTGLFRDGKGCGTVYFQPNPSQF